jgi:5-methylcytosine-specific restriction endonuclease McrA
LIENAALLPPLQSAAAAVEAGEVTKGREALAPIAGKLWLERVPRAPVLRSRPFGQVATTRRNFSIRLVAQAMQRDRFHCRYCSQRIVPVRVLASLSALYPDALPYYEHYTTGTVHPAFWLVAAEGDHLIPGSRGGAWSDLDNIVTACVRCNARKSNLLLEEIGWTLEPASADGCWDGLTGCYARICEAAGCRDDSYHLEFLSALGIAAPTRARRAGGANVRRQRRAARPPARQPEPHHSRRLEATAEVAEDADRYLTEWASAHGWMIVDGRSRSFVPAAGAGRRTGVRIPAAFLERNPAVELDLKVLRQRGKTADADGIQAALSRLAGRRVTANFPSLSCSIVVSEWDTMVRDVLEPYRLARR